MNFRLVVMISILGIGACAMAEPSARESSVFRDISGNECHPLQVTLKGNVLLFVTVDCPISNAMSPEMMRIYKAFRTDFSFFLVHVDPNVTVDAAKRHAKEYSLVAPVLLDPQHHLVKATGARMTPEAVVILPDKSLGYVGRINNLYAGFGKRRARVTDNSLRDALDAIREGEKVGVPRTKAVGCYIADLKRASD